jgi:hypothetical protein
MRSIEMATDPRCPLEIYFLIGVPEKLIVGCLHGRVAGGGVSCAINGLLTDNI